MARKKSSESGNDVIISGPAPQALARRRTRMRPSLQSRIFNWMLKAINFKKLVEKRAYRHVSKSQKKFVPQGIKRSYLTRLQKFNAKEIATFESKEKVTTNHVIFFHGGAYKFGAAPNHWRLAEKIVKQSFCRMTLIDYPLAPEHNYTDTFSMVSGAYDLLTTQYSGDSFILMGDSAGGGLALAFAQKLIKEKHGDPPAKIVLLSPWLDLSMSNPNIKHQESSDYILTVHMLRHAGMKYSNGGNQDQYLLSPIHGELNNLPETIVFCGTEELFYADCIRLKSMIGSDKQGIIFKEYPKMQHDWLIFPIPESKQAVKEICEFINA